MTIERVRVLVRHKPWGVADLGPWCSLDHGSGPIGELTYERADAAAPAASLLLKLLFTSAPLSIQVHPDDAYAKSIDLPNGKSEAWYVLDAAPGAMVALGLTRSVTRDQLRRAIDDSSIEQLVQWQTVDKHDAISVPAGTVHAIGAGLIIAEIQQRSDATFRLFDYGRNRGLHADDGVSVAHLGAAAFQIAPRQLSEERLLLVSNAYFVFERISLQPGSHWHLDAAGETWLLTIEGDAKVGPIGLTQGGCVFAQTEHVDIRAGRCGMICLVAYAGDGGPTPQLLNRMAPQNTPGIRTLGNEPNHPRTNGMSP